MLRNRKALIPYLLLAALLAGAVLWRESEMVPGLGKVTVTGTPAVGGPFRLTDQNGAAKTDRDYRGRYMLVYFGYSFCPDVCPTTLAVMSQALDKLGAQRARVTPIFITIDPGRDTPKVLKDYVKAFGPDFVGLTGPQDAITKVEREYRVYAVKRPLGNSYGMDHSSVIFLMGPDGKLVSFYDEAISPDDLAKDIRAKI
jgi:protein SCO1/2